MNLLEILCILYGLPTQQRVNQLEELGIDDVDPEDLLFAFTCPAEQANIGGCNAYEDVYIVQQDKENTLFSIGKVEVTAVKWVEIQVLERALRGGDDAYVPRAPSYINAFFAYLAKLCE